jgi:hypothetical protein
MRSVDSFWISGLLADRRCAIVPLVDRHVEGVWTTAFGYDHSWIDLPLMDAAGFDGTRP